MSQRMFLIAMALLAAAWATLHQAQAGSKAPGFSITTRKTDDRVEVTGDADKVLFVITSPYGISRATIERKEERWPKSVALRLKLKGLESFRAESDKIKIDAAVSLAGGKLHTKVWKDGKEDELLTEKSPFWVEIAPRTAEGKPATALPLKDGHFEITLPAALFADNPKTLTLNWIDFFRR